MKQVIGICEGTLSIPQYLEVVRIAKSNLNHTFKRSFSGWCPSTGNEIVAQFVEGVHDRINKRGGLQLGKEMNWTRLTRNLVRTVKCECRWCGSEMTFKYKQDRFCDVSCRKLYS